MYYQVDEDQLVSSNLTERQVQHMHHYPDSLTSLQEIQDPKSCFRVYLKMVQHSESHVDCTKIGEQ